MLNIIDGIKPYDLKYLDSTDKCLLFYKNVLRIISKKGCQELNSNKIYPVRWSNIKKEFVIDFRTKKTRDINGICLKTISQYYKEDSEDYGIIKVILEEFSRNKDDKYWDSINFKKNENKFIAVTYSNDKLFHIRGIYLFCEYKNRPGVFTIKNKRSIIVDNSITTNEKICKIIGSNNIIIPNQYHIKSYIEDFREFKTYIINKSMTFHYEEKEINIKLYDNIQKKFKFDKSKIECKISLKEKDISNNSIENLLPYILYEEFFLFIKKKLGFNNSIILYDQDIEKNILFEEISYKEKPLKESNEFKNDFLFPGVF